MEIKIVELACGWTIEFNFKEYCPFKSSYHVIGARLLGFYYPDYLRYCRTLGAEIRGTQGYSFPIWKTKAGAEKLLSQLKEALKEVEDLL